MIKELNSESNSVTVEVYDDSGLPVEGLDASTFPDVFYRRAAASTGQLALLTLATESAPWTDGGVKESAEGGGKYRLDLSNFLFTSAGDVTIWGEASGKHMLPVLLEVRANVLFTEDYADIGTSVAASLAGIDVTVFSSVAGGTITIWTNSDNTIDLSRQIRVTVPAGVFPNIDDADTLYLGVTKSTDNTGGFTLASSASSGSNSGSQTIDFEPGRTTETNLLDPTFDYKATVLAVYSTPTRYVPIPIDYKVRVMVNRVVVP